MQAAPAAPPLRAETSPPQKRGFFGKFFGGGGNQEEPEVVDLDGYLHALIMRASSQLLCSAY